MNESTDENDAKKRKRGRRGGQRRGFGQQRSFKPGGFRSGKLRPRGRGRPRKPGSTSKYPAGILFVKDGSYIGYHCAFCNCSLNSRTTMIGHVSGSRHQMNRATRNLGRKKKWEARASYSESENSTRDVASLKSLPDGILLVETGSYVGYHCTYCNCPLHQASNISPHVEGFRHQLLIEARNRLEEQKKTEANGEKSALETEEKSEKNVGLLEDSSSKVSEPSKSSLEDASAATETEEKDESNVDAELLEDSKASVPLTSSLEDALAAVSEPVIGLNYIIKKHDEAPSYECSLCSVISEIDDMKAHVVGTRHRLMYMKKVDPEKIAELMARNLPKSERNREIREYIASAMEKHGKGTVVVESSETPLSKASQEKGHQGNSDKLRKNVDTVERKAHQGTTNKSRRSVDVVGPAKRKRVNEENSSRQKHHLGRYNAGKQISKEKFTGRDKHSYGDSGPSFEQQSYDQRQTYGSDKERLFQPSHLPRQNIETAAADPPKLPDIEVTNEQEAGIVMNVISSLTERFLKYKLKNVSGLTKETLEKSLKGENLLHTLGLITDESTDKPSFLPQGDKAPQSQPVSKERRDAAGMRSYQDWTKETDMPMRSSTGQLQGGWKESKDAMYLKGRTYQTYVEQAKHKDVIDWNKVREGKSVDPVVQSSHGWGKTMDGRSRDLMNQSWDERDIRSDKGITDYQMKQQMGSIRGNTYGDDTMSHSDWSHSGNTSSIKNQFPPNWNEPRLSSNLQNKDSFSKTSYSLDKYESIPLRSAASFNQQQQNWGVGGQSQAQQAWNRADQSTAMSGNGRAFGRSVMNRDDGIYGRGSIGSLTPQLQSNMPSFSQRRNVDNLLEKYEMKPMSEKGRSSLNTIISGSHNYATPTLTTRSHYLGPSTPSMFSRPSSFGQSQSTSSLARWNY